MGRENLRPRALLMLLIIGLAGFGLTWSIQSSLGGRAPTKVFDEPLPSSPRAPLDSRLEKMKTEAGADPAKKAAYAKELVARINADPHPGNALILEAVAALHEVLAADPRDSFALQAMADLSFDQQVFDKAVGFYERYLVINPDDDGTRARYASALAFTGKTEEAITNLEQVLKRRPNDFHALAYLSIAKAQSGDRDEALRIGDKALAAAPNEEAKQRFTQFLKSVAGSAEAGQVKTPAAARPAEGKTAAIEHAVRQSPIASRRFTRAEIGPEGEVRLYFRDFPIKQMPQGVRDTFLDKLAGEVNAALPEAKNVALIDEASGETILEKTLR